MTTTEGPYERGESIVLYADWADDDGTPIAPLDPRIELTSPAGTETAFAEADLTAPSTGRREVGFTIPDAAASEGLWVCRRSSGGPRPKVATTTFQVLKPG